MALTNTQPFRVTMPRERFIEGEHTAQIIVFGRDGSESRSGAITFTIQ